MICAFYTKCASCGKYFSFGLFSVNIVENIFTHRVETGSLSWIGVGGGEDCDSEDGVRLRFCLLSLVLLVRPVI